MYSGRAAPSTTAFEITTSSTPSRLGRSNMVSSRSPSMIERRPRAPVLRVDGFAGNGAERLLHQREIDRLHLEQPLVLLHQRVLWLGENKLERGFVEILERGNDGQSADELGNQAVFQQVLGLDFTENFAGLAVLRRQDLGAEADRGRSPARGDDLLEPIEGASAHEQNVGGVDLQEFLLRML